MDRQSWKSLGRHFFHICIPTHLFLLSLDFRAKTVQSYSFLSNLPSIFNDFTLFNDKYDEIRANII